MDIKEAFEIFIKSLAIVNDHIGFAYRRDCADEYICHLAVQNLITDSAFLQLYIAWESFLENTFLCYIMGEASISGNTAEKYTYPLDIKHANNLLKGNQKFVDWGNADAVRKISQLHFEKGEPFYSVIVPTRA